MPIDSWAQLQAQVDSILERLNADTGLALAAAVNPLYALEELGFQIAPHARADIEDRLRFRPRVAVRVRALREEIYRQAGRPFDLDSAEELGRILFDRLGIVPPRASPARLYLRPLVSEPGHRGPTPDPLDSLRGAHAIIEPLLEYRRLEASEPRLAPRTLYDDVRRGRRRLGVLRVRGRLKRRP